MCISSCLNLLRNRDFDGWPVKDDILNRGSLHLSERLIETPRLIVWCGSSRNKKFTVTPRDYVCGWYSGAPHPLEMTVFVGHVKSDHCWFDAWNPCEIIASCQTLRGSKKVSQSNSPLATCPHTLRGIRGCKVTPEVAADPQSHWSTRHTWGEKARQSDFGLFTSSATCAAADEKNLQRLFREVILWVESVGWKLLNVCFRESSWFGFSQPLCQVQQRLRAKTAGRFVFWHLTKRQRPVAWKQIWWKQISTSPM